MTVFLLSAVIAAIILVTAVWKIHPLPALLFGAFIFGVCNGNGVLKTIELLSTGFGGTIRSIGIVIIAGTIIGAFMEQRGALGVIARKIIALTGKKRTPLAMSIIGYVVSICIFCDSAFIILIGLWRKIGTLAKLPLAVGATALSMGLFASHCFIPPTPGPLAALSILGADFGYVLLFGSIAALAAAAAGYLYAYLAGRSEILDLPQSAKEEAGEEETRFHFHWSVAFLPLIIPLLLIAGNSIAEVGKNHLPSQLIGIMSVLGNPVIALTIGALLSVFAIGHCRRTELTADGLIGKAVLDAANILVITGAGGAFGEVLKHVDFASLLPDNVRSAGAFALLVPLAFAAALKIAQGSSTLAILTAASLTAPLLEPLHLTSPMMRALACCAVCCGGMIVSHANDSYFWVVVKFSGMSVRQGLKLQTCGTLAAGLAGSAAILLLALLMRGF